jgi:hypothetical protein
MPDRIPEHRNLPAIIPPQKPSFLQVMKEGVALGVGSSLGHRIVGAIMGPTQIQAVDKKQEEYEKCMKEYDDRGVCQRILGN